MCELAKKILKLEKDLRDYAMVMTIEQRASIISKLEFFRGLLKGLKSQ